MTTGNEGDQSGSSSSTRIAGLLNRIPDALSVLAMVIATTWYLSQTITELTVQVSVLADKVENISSDEENLPQRVAILEILVGKLLKDDTTSALLDNAQETLEKRTISTSHLQRETHKND